VIDGFVKDSSKKTLRGKVVSGQMHQRTEKGRTLMRGGLNKPAKTLGAGIEHFSGAVNIQREVRAKGTPRHHHVERFGVPKVPPKQHTYPKPVSGELVSRRPQSKSAQAAQPPLPSMVTSVSHQKLEKMLDQALTHADTHKEALRYHAARHFWHRRWLSGHRRWYALAVLLLVVVAAIGISWQRFPQLSVKAAGMRAHLSPTVPGYVPEGYKLAGPAKAISGTVDIKYTSGDKASSSYEVVQAQSELTSSLVGQSVVPKGAPVQTTQVEGNTVFIYGNSNDAAWVNNGVLYKVKDRANLSSDELIKIVQGLNP
jgi:hypothetical protein